MKPSKIIYTDASFDEKNKIAGIGILIKEGMKERVYSLWTPARTVNEAELFAIYIADILGENSGTIYTDSQTAISYINREIKEKLRTKEQYLNHKYCEFWAYKLRQRNVKPQKIKAHEHKFQVHSIGNRRADLLAQEGRAKYYFSYNHLKSL